MLFCYAIPLVYNVWITSTFQFDAKIPFNCIIGILLLLEFTWNLFCLYLPTWTVTLSRHMLHIRFIECNIFNETNFYLSVNQILGSEKNTLKCFYVRWMKDFKIFTVDIQIKYKYSFSIKVFRWNGKINIYI